MATLGYGWGNAHTDLTGNGNHHDVRKPPQTQLPLSPLPFAQYQDTGQGYNGVIGGAQLGYNYQFSPNVVLGLRADVPRLGSTQKQYIHRSVLNSSLRSGDLTPGMFASSRTALLRPPAQRMTSYQAEIDWFGTVRARLGYFDNRSGLNLWDRRTWRMVGCQFQAAERMFSAATSGNSPIFFPPAVPRSVLPRLTLGFPVGGGIEGRFSYWLPPNWTWKLEYLYLDLGSLDTAPTPFAGSILNGPGGSGAIVTTGTISTHTHFTDNIVRVGLNYQFH